MLKNEYTLNVDIKRKFTAVVPTFVQNDTAVLIFKVLDNGRPFNLEGVTRVEVSHKRKDGTTVIGLAEYSVIDGSSIIKYVYLGNEMSKEGFVETAVTIFKGDERVSIRPFSVSIVADLRNTVGASEEYGLLQDLIVAINEEITLNKEAVADTEDAIANAYNAATETLEVANSVKYIEDYKTTTSYKKNNFVSFNGSTYMAKKDTKNVAPPSLPETSNDSWVLAGRKGADGTGTVVRHKDEFIATQNQKVFNLSNTYDQFQNRINVTVGSVPQYSPDNFNETTSTSITFEDDIPQGVKVIVEYFSEAQPLASDIQTTVTSHTQLLNSHTSKLSQNKTELEAVTQQLAATAKKDEVVSANDRIDNLIIVSGNANAEVTDSHVSTPKQKTFNTLNRRFEEIEEEATLLAKNLVVNGSFENDATGWMISGTAPPVIDTSVSLDGLKSTKHVVNGQSSVARQEIAIPEGHKVFLSADVYLKSWSTGLSALEVYDGGAYNNMSQGLIDSLKLNQWQRTTVVKTMGSGVSGIRLVVGSISYSIREYNVDNVMVLDLTAMFGAGNEPTAAEMENYLTLRSKRWFDGESYILTKRETIKKIANLDSAVKNKLDTSAFSAESVAVNKKITDLQTESSLQADNLAINGSYENDFIGWGTGGGALPTIETTLAYLGGKSVKLLTKAQSSVTRQEITVPGGSKLYFAAYARLNEYTNGLNALEMYDGGGYLNRASALLNSGRQRQWQWVSGTKTTDVGITGVRLVVGSVENTTRDLLVDTVFVLNLTTIFGAGNEPTRAEMDGLMSKRKWFAGKSYITDKTTSIKNALTLETNQVKVSDKLNRKTRWTPAISLLEKIPNSFSPHFWRNGELYITISNEIRKTTDNGKTTQLVSSFTSGSITNLMHLDDDSALCILRNGDNLSMKRSTDFITWIDVLSWTNPHGPMIGNLGWDHNGSTVMFGEYTTVDAVTKPKIEFYKSTDYGATWKVSKTWNRAGEPRIRHIHAVQYDKYSNRWWISTGDALATEASILSTADGIDFVTEVAPGHPSLTAVSLAFNRRYIIWGQDLQLSNDFTIHTMNKVTKEVKTVGYMNNVAYYILEHPRGGYLLFDQVEEYPERGVYSNNMFVYWSEDGFTWNRIYEIPLNVGDILYLYNLTLNSDGSLLNFRMRYTPKGGVEENSLQTLAVEF